MHDVSHPDAGGEVSAEALARMSREELEALYAQAGAPDGLEALDGEPRGVVLAVTGLDREPAASWIRRISGAGVFPWKGKSFRSDGGDRGEGANRIQPLGEIAAFSTSIGASEVDGLPCVVLDYDRPGNPWPIRKIRDELRELSPGLLFGPAMVDLGGRRRTLLYFAVEFGAG